MAYEILTLVLQWVHAAFLLIALMLSMFVIRDMYGSYFLSGVMLYKRRVFTLLSPGLAAMLIGFLLRYLFPQDLQVLAPADLFFGIAYILFAVALGYFWLATRSMHSLHWKEMIFMLGVLCCVFIWDYYLLIVGILPKSAAIPLESMIIASAYTVLVSVIFLLTLIIHPLLKAGVIRTPLWYISSGILAYFLGFMIQQQHVWNSAADRLPPVYSALFLVSAFFIGLGFEAALKKYR
jgi:hypothetical protein